MLLRILTSMLPVYAAVISLKSGPIDLQPERANTAATDKPPTTDLIDMAARAPKIKKVI
jgi:hypothetical protein